MLTTHNQERGSGKTTKVIELLNKDKNSILIIPANYMKNVYPNELANRIFSCDNVLQGFLRGKNFSKAILDEGFMQDKEKLAHLYYYLGSNQIETTAYGTV